MSDDLLSVLKFIRQKHQALKPQLFACQHLTVNPRYYDLTNIIALTRSLSV